ncbi:MAG: hypothetical protein K0B00_05405 [Rhodobacteraceae bacterium]|nr:hypothetical protein [Paracoccaceae bacterium]
MTRRSPLRQLRHVGYEVGFKLASLVSQTANALAFGGSTHLTTSAEAGTWARPSWMTEAEADASPKVAAWRRRERIINKLLAWWEHDHCAKARAAAVYRARWTLYRCGEGPNPDAASDE